MKKIFTFCMAVILLTACLPFVYAENGQANDWHTSSQEQTYLDAALVAIEDGRVIILEPDETVDSINREIEVPCNRAGCTGTIRSVSTRYTSWKLTGQTEDCDKNWKLKDLEESSTATTEYQCSRCGYGFDASSPQRHWTCSH